MLSESRVERGNDAKTPGPIKTKDPISKSTEEKSGAYETRKQTMKRTQTDSEERKRKKRRVVESSDEESEEEDENERTNEKRDGETTTTENLNNGKSDYRGERTIGYGASELIENRRSKENSY